VSLKGSCIGFRPNMSMIVLSEKPQTNAARPAAPIRISGRGGRVKVRPATDSAGPV
jgi:hypothetical protein